MKKDNEKLIQNINLLLAVNKEFGKEIIELQKGKNSLPEDIDEDYYEEWFELEEARKLISKHERENKGTITELREKYNLSYAYHDHIQFLLSLESGDSILKSEGIPSPFFTDTPNKGKLVVLPITEETTIKDIQKAWPYIQRSLRMSLGIEKKPNKQSLRKNLDRDLEIYKLKEEGKKGKEITRVINEKYPNTLISYQDISKIIIRLKNEAKKITSSPRKET